MKQKNLDNAVKDNEKLMTRSEIIEYLKGKITNYNENEEALLYSGFNSGSLASINDFERIAFDSPF
jgi:hypothetical protein